MGAVATHDPGGLVVVVAGLLGSLVTKIFDHWKQRREAKQKATTEEHSEERAWRDELREDAKRALEVVERLQASEQRAWATCREVQEREMRLYQSGLIVARRMQDMEDQLAELNAERDLLLGALPDRTRDEQR